MFVSNDIPNLEAFLRKSIYSFTTRLSSSSNKLICAIEQSWIMKSVIWKTWEEKICTFKSTVMSFSVFLVFILPDFICSFFYFILSNGLLVFYTLYIFMHYEIKSILSYLILLYFCLTCFLEMSLERSYYWI